MTEDEQAVWDAMQAVYAGFLAGDAAASDAHLADDVTIWDSAEPGLVRGLEQLQQLRARRPAASTGPVVVAIEATEPVIDIWDDTALLRHLLRVRFAGVEPADEIVRNTSVWRHTDGRWLAVHNHEDVLATASGHEDVPATASGHEGAPATPGQERAFYADPENQVPEGPPVRRRAGPG